MSDAQPVLEAIDYLLARGRRSSVDLEVLATTKKSTSISFQNRKLDQFSFSETRQIGVRVVQGNNEGIAFSESLDHESLDNMLNDAIANARMIHRDWVATMHDGSNLPDMPGLHNPEIEKISVEEKIQVARELESAALERDPRIASVAYSRYGDSTAQMWIANTRGLQGNYKTNSCHAYARCLAGDGTSNVMSGEVRVGRDFRKLDARQIAHIAADKTLARLGAIRPETGKYSIIFENRVAEDLLGLIGSYFSAKSVDEQHSPLAGKMNQRIFSPKITLTDDPFLPEALGSRPFDDEGYSSEKTVLVYEGQLHNLLTSSVMARKMGLPHTASASRGPATEINVSPSNLVIAPGRSHLGSMLNSQNKVILITDLLGHAGFRRGSGDFSLPFEGDLYENGKRIVALKDFLISGNILDVFNQVEEVGNDVLSPLGGTISPSLLVHDLNIAGQT